AWLEYPGFGATGFARPGSRYTRIRSTGLRYTRLKYADTTYTGSIAMTIAITWWGHARATLDCAGVRVALDPLFSRRLAHLRRHGPPPGPRAAEADVVLLSHLHGDHLHLPSLRRFDPDVPIVVPRGAGGLLRDLPHPFI